MATSMRMYKQPGFDVMKDFAHIGRIGISELAVVTSPDSGIGTMRELIVRARKEGEGPHRPPPTSTPRRCARRSAWPRR